MMPLTKIMEDHSVSVFHSVFMLNNESSSIYYMGGDIVSVVKRMYDGIIKSSDPQWARREICRCVQERASRVVNTQINKRFGDDWCRKGIEKYKRESLGKSLGRIESEMLQHQIYSEVFDFEFVVNGVVRRAILKNPKEHSDCSCEHCEGSGLEVVTTNPLGRIKSWSIGGEYTDYFSDPPIKETALSPGICRRCKGSRIINVNPRTAIGMFNEFGHSFGLDRCTEVKTVCDKNPVSGLKMIMGDHDLCFLDDDCHQIGAQLAIDLYDRGESLTMKCPSCSGFNNTRCMGSVSTVSRFSDIIQADRRLVPDALLIEGDDDDPMGLWYEQKRCGLFNKNKNWSIEQWIETCRKFVDTQPCDCVCVSVQCTE